MKKILSFFAVALMMVAAVSCGRSATVEAQDSTTEDTIEAVDTLITVDSAELGEDVAA